MDELYSVNFIATYFYSFSKGDFFPVHTDSVRDCSSAVSMVARMIYAVQRVFRKALPPSYDKS